ALKPRLVDARYTYYLMLSGPVRACLESSVESVTNSHKRARVDRFLASRVEVPDLPTQKAIADFLDRETARIDQLIEKKQRLVEALQSKRISLISEAVTTGIDGSLDLVETNYQFVPKVPHGWKLWRLKHLADVRGGLTIGRAVPIERPVIPVSYLRVANVQAGWIDLSDVAEAHVTSAEVEKYSLAEGDVLMNEGGGQRQAWSRCRVDGSIPPLSSSEPCILRAPKGETLRGVDIAGYECSICARLFLFTLEPKHQSRLHIKKQSAAISCSDSSPWRDARSIISRSRCFGSDRPCNFCGSNFYRRFKRVPLRPHHRRRHRPDGRHHLGPAWGD